jgi:hypothetical protein
MDLTGSRYGPLRRSAKCGNETERSMKGGNFVASWAFKNIRTVVFVTVDYLVTWDPIYES